MPAISRRSLSLCLVATLASCVPPHRLDAAAPPGAVASSPPLATPDSEVSAAPAAPAASAALPPAKQAELSARVPPGRLAAPKTTAAVGSPRVVLGGKPSPPAEIAPRVARPLPAAPATAPPPGPVVPAAPVPPAPAAPAVAATEEGPRNDARYAMGMPLPNLPALGAEPEAPAAAEETAAPAAVSDDSSTAADLILRIRSRTGLSDADLQRLQLLESQLKAGDDGALPALQDMDVELAAAALLYTVKSGDQPWLIAAQPEVYGNRSLWPLIWNANRGELPRPQALRAGLKLHIPQHPTVDEVSQALAWAREHTPP